MRIHCTDVFVNIFRLKGISYIFLLFHVNEHEIISRMGIYCNGLSLLVPKLVAKMYKI